MRTLEQINNIKQTFSDPYVVDNFITETDINQLVELFDAAPDKLHKNTGPITLNLQQYSSHHVIREILKKIEQEIGKYKINSAFFFHTDFPHIIHNDDLLELPDNTYKAVVVPLRTYGGTRVGDYPDLCFFDQCYFHGPSKFFNGDSNLPTYYNKQLYEYSDVDGVLNHNPITDEVYQQYFTHLKRKWLDGLSVHSVLPWVPGKCIIFDSVRLHCSSDFRKQIKSKLAISIFTKKV